MAGVKGIDINEKEKDLKESPPQSDTNGQSVVLSPRGEKKETLGII
jgi:hypothetical protein